MASGLCLQPWHRPWGLGFEAELLQVVGFLHQARCCCVLPTRRPLLTGLPAGDAGSSLTVPQQDLDSGAAISILRLCRALQSQKARSLDVPEARPSGREAPSLSTRKMQSESFHDHLGFRRQPGGSAQLAAPERHDQTASHCIHHGEARPNTGTAGCWFLFDIAFYGTVRSPHRPSLFPLALASQLRPRLHSCMQCMHASAVLL